MGMDVHGLNPKMNKSIDNYKTYEKWNKIDWKDRDGKYKKEWEKEKDTFYSEMDKREKDNRGIYFRNSCWWWRPLWDYCRHVAPHLISEELWESGHHNDGRGLNAKDAKELGEILMENIANGSAIQYEKDYNDMYEGEEYFYPYDVENVENFALFCIESGGFEIC
tara:strand:- start:8523 stop:9017 length:495 start_codon:yes stop_codon:yes gene_type:complete